MKSNIELTEGQKLVFTGKVFDGFNSQDPYVIFLGYDSGGWNDLWVDYKGQTLMVHTDDVELFQ